MRQWAPQVPKSTSSSLGLYEESKLDCRLDAPERPLSLALTVKVAGIANTPCRAVAVPVLTIEAAEKADGCASEKAG